MNLLLFQGQHFIQSHASVEEHGKHGFVADVSELPAAVIVQHLPDLIFIEGTNLDLGLLDVLHLCTGVSLNVTFLDTVFEEYLESL